MHGQNIRSRRLWLRMSLYDDDKVFILSRTNCNVEDETIAVKQPWRIRMNISSNYIHYKVWHEIIYPFLNFNGAIVEV